MIPQLACRGSGLCGGQNLVFLVGACRLLRTGCARPFCWAGRSAAANLHPLCTPRASFFGDQRFLGCIRGGNSPWTEFVRGHGGCLLTKRGRKQHRHRPKRTKISNERQYSMQTQGVPNSPFQGLRGFPTYPTYPSLPMGHSADSNEATMAMALKTHRVGTNVIEAERFTEWFCGYCSHKTQKQMLPHRASVDSARKGGCGKIRVAVVVGASLQSGTSNWVLAWLVPSIFPVSGVRRRMFQSPPPPFPPEHIVGLVGLDRARAWMILLAPCDQHLHPQRNHDNSRQVPGGAIVAPVQLMYNRC